MPIAASFSAPLVIVIGVTVACSSAGAQAGDADLRSSGQNTASESIGSGPPGNPLCPVTRDEEIDPSFFTVHEGRRIYFCCRRCKSKFNADAAAYLAALPVVTPVSLQTSHEHGVHDEEEAHAHEEQGEHAGHEHDEQVTQDEAEHEHDHRRDHGSGETFAALPWLGRFHVLVIHFPIALLSIGALFELVGWLGRKPGVEAIVRATVGLGALSAAAAVLLGLANAIEADYSGTLSWVFWWHRALGITTAVVGILAWLALTRRRRQPTPQRIVVARTAILLAATLVGVTGHFGGSLVFGWNYLMP